MTELNLRKIILDVDGVQPRLVAEDLHRQVRPPQQAHLGVNGDNVQLSVIDQRRWSQLSEWKLPAVGEEDSSGTERRYVKLARCVRAR